MRRNSALIVRIVIASMAICGLINAQSSPARRTPVLTNDDLGSSSREPVRSSATSTESEAQPVRKTSVENSRSLINWQRDLNRAFDVAKAEGKLLVVDVYTDWCGWCKQMDKTIYSDQAIVALSRKHVFVKLNAEDRGQGQEFAQQMRVSGYPTTIILDGQARVLQLAEGYIPSTGAFLEFFEKARSAQAR